MDMQTAISENAISVENVTKQIGGRVLLEEINLHIPVGSISGIIGHNGAGKSILLRIISGLVFPTAGVVKIFGETLGKEIEFPRNFGALIEEPGLLPQYSGFDNLFFLSKIRNRMDAENIRETIRLVGLDPFDKRPTKIYSTGMRQRLGIATAIMENPDLLLLDEPISGLDPQGIEDIHKLLQSIHKKGVTILLTSHSREEIDSLCDASYVMNSGKLSALKGLKIHK
jgi:ABC-2 type transport system ATP-binding protein